MATHCSLLAWRIPGTEKPDGAMGSQRVGYYRATKQHALLVGMLIGIATMEELPQEIKNRTTMLLLLLLRHFSHVRLCATP